MSAKTVAAENKKNLVVKMATSLRERNGNVSAQDVVDELEKHGVSITVHSVRRYAGIANFSFDGRRGRPYTDEDKDIIIAAMSSDNPPTQKEIARELGRSAASIGYKIRAMLEKGEIAESTVSSGRKVMEMKVEELLNLDNFDFDIEEEDDDVDAAVDAAVEELTEGGAETDEKVDAAVEELTEGDETVEDDDEDEDEENVLEPLEPGAEE